MRALAPLALMVALISPMMIWPGPRTAAAAVLKNNSTGETIRGSLTSQKINGMSVFKLNDGNTKLVKPSEWTVIEADAEVAVPPPPAGAAPDKKGAQAASPKPTSNPSAQSLEEWNNWEAEQSKLDAEHRAFDIKGDRLGMTLSMFKAKYHRIVPKDSRTAPFCSDANPDKDNPLLGYTSDLQKAGIVHARTTFPFEEYGANPNLPTIAGVPVKLFLYRFIDGKLYEMAILFDQNHFAEVSDALKVKYGEPSLVKARTYQNPFGATFDGRIVSWGNAVSAMVASERAGQLDTSTLIITHKELKALAEDRKQEIRKARAKDL